MMTRPEFDATLERLGVTQVEAARLLSVSERTFRRWAEQPDEMPGPAALALRAWCRLEQMKLPWRPDSDALGNLDADQVAEQIALHREHTIRLDTVLERVRARGGPSSPWKVDLEKRCASLGPIWISFYPLASGSFSPSHYRRSDKENDLRRDMHLIEDGYACVAAAIAAAGRNWASPTKHKHSRMTIRPLPRMLHIPILHIDTNLINARGKLASMNTIEKWAEDDVIIVNMSGVSFEEAQEGNDTRRTRKALTRIFTIADEPISVADPMYVKVKGAIFPGVRSLSKNQENDVKIVCDAAKYTAILVTHDGNSRRQPGGILGNREKLRGVVQILSDEEAVAYVRAKILERDNFNIRAAREFGASLPEWTGKD